VSLPQVGAKTQIASSRDQIVRRENDSCRLILAGVGSIPEVRLLEVNNFTFFFGFDEFYF
jgi:hypothetical protein